MLINYLKIALRNIKRNKVHSAINILGLATGMACFFLIMFFVRWELSYDSFHEKADRVFRVIVKSNHGTFNLGKTTMGVIPAPMATTMAEEFPEVIRLTRVHRARNFLFKYAEKKFVETGLYADPNFLKIFSFPLAKGNAKTALREPLTMVVTEELGKKIFGDDDPVGKTLIFPYREKIFDIKVTGILKKIPKNSHLKFDYLISLISWKVLDGEAKYAGRWNNWNAFVYVELDPNTDPDEFSDKLPAHLAKHSGQQRTSSFVLQPIKSIHLKSDAFIEISENYKMSNIYIFSCIAFVILFIACINYINLVTARASRRSKEIGIRKVVGARRKQLVRQLLGESIVLSFTAFFAAVFLLTLFFPAFRAFVDKPMEISIFSDAPFLLEAIGLVFLVGLLAGIFPALYLSSFRPVSALKGIATSSAGRFNMRNVLVIIQFSISIILIAVTLTIVKQMNYIRSRNMGFDREQVLVIDVRYPKLRDHILNIKSTVLQNTNVLGASLSDNLPTNIVPRITARVEEGTLPDSKDSFGSYYTVVDQDFLDVHGIELLSGRNFSEKFTRESEESVIINETVANRLGWKEPIGKMYKTIAVAENGRVIGVIKDFHFQSLHHSIQPLTLMFGPNWCRYLSLKINSSDIKGTIGFIRETVESFKPDYPFTYFFLDESFDEMYQEEQKLGKLFGNFTTLAVFISCLGLFGLASFAVETRIKEVGIRKVLGASISSIMMLISKGLTRSVFFANIFAWPVAYFVSYKWLENFAYRVNLGMGIFILSGLASLAIALLTISCQTIKAATANPVDSLRYE
jgi:putative ABC transport system permease protein